MMNKISREDIKRTAQTHRTNIEKMLQHRIEVARAKGDTELVRQLEAEMQQ